MVVLWRPKNIFGKVDLTMMAAMTLQRCHRCVMASAPWLAERQRFLTLVEFPAEVVPGRLLLPPSWVGKELPYDVPQRH